MGIFDALFTEDPKQQAYNAMAMQLLGAQKMRGQRGAFGSALADSMAAGQNAMNQGRAREFEKKMQGAKLAEIEYAANQRKKQQEKDDALITYTQQFFKPAQAERLDTSAINSMMPEDMRISGTPGRAASPAGFDMSGFLSGLPTVKGMSPLAAIEMQKKFEPKPVEYDPTVRYSGDGRSFVMGKDGNPKFLTGISPRDKLVETNLGGKVALRSEYSPVTVAEMNKTVSPDAQLSANTSMRGQNMTDSRARDANNIAKQLGITEKELRIDELQGKREDRMRSKDAAKASVINQIGVIDKALNHPGRETATGLSGTINPTNYIPGTDATDFRAVLDQIGGTAFLQAFESLKGGGAITEVEGKKATDAIARLNRAQSDAEFKKSLQDLRSVMAAGANRLGATPQTGGASGSFDTPQMPQGFRVVR